MLGDRERSQSRRSSSVSYTVWRSSGGSQEFGQSLPPPLAHLWPNDYEDSYANTMESSQGREPLQTVLQRRPKPLQKTPQRGATSS